MIKVIMSFKRKQGCSPEEFSRHWSDVHGPLVVKLLPGLKKYIQNHPVTVPGGRSQFDGVAELWFDDEESWRKAGDFYSGDAGKAIRDDEGTFIDSSSRVYFTAQEKVIK